MPDVAPFEIIAAPFRVYLAPVGTAIGDIDEDPGAPWGLLGTSGDLNMSEAGVTLAVNQTIVETRVLGSTMARKAHRTEESYEFSFELIDLSLENLKSAFNDAAVVDVPAASGTPGYREISVERGPLVATYAAQFIGDVSPYGSGWRTRYIAYQVYYNGNPSIVLNKGESSKVPFSFRALRHSSLGVGKWQAQDATALP